MKMVACGAIFAIAVTLLLLASSAVSAHGVHEKVEWGEVARRQYARRHVQAASNIPPQPETCGVCEPVAQDLFNFLANKSDEKEIARVLEGVCAVLFKGNSGDTLICDALVLELAKHMPELMQALAGLKWNIPKTLCAFIDMCKMYCCEDAFQPEQIHLSYAHSVPAQNPDLNVRWVTFYGNFTSYVKWRAVGATEWQQVAAQSTTYTAGSWVGTIRIATMTGLANHVAYEYQVGADAHWSEIFKFNTLPSNAGTEARPLRFVQIADMGWMTNFSGNTEHALTKLAATGSIDFILHVGDISYADGDMGKWDVFSREIQPIAARVPYMTVPGNHEIPFNFTAYKRRFGDAMPAADLGAPSDASYYMLQFPPAVSFVMIDSESPIDTPEINDAQIAWIKQAMGRVNAKRAATPFLLAMHHRPLYCTGWSSACNGGKDAAGNVGYLQGLVEGIYNTQRVDAVVCGHVHDYERTWPVKDSIVQGKSYVNATAPFYIVNGAGGNHEGLEHATLSQPWEAAAVNEWGFLVVEATPTIFSAKYIQANTNKIVDQWVIRK
jgi:hypothetical protein